MSHGFGLMIESLVALLLLVTIGYCMILNGRLKRLRADEQSLKATFAELVTASEMAERAVAGLKGTAREVENTLGERLKTAERFCGELNHQIAAGDILLARLSNAVVAARSLGTGATAMEAPDPKAVAVAARSFADRLRVRVGALAA